MSTVRAAACMLLSMWLVPVAQAQDGGAQSPPLDGVFFGAHLGLDASKLDGSTGDASFGVGAVASVSVAAPVSRHFWIQPEVGLSTKHADGSCRTERTCRIDFLDVSTLAVLRGRKGSIRPFAGVGPAVAFRIGASLPEYHGWYGSKPTEWRRVDVQLVATLGLSSDVSARTVMTIDVRYWHGLLDLDPSVDYSDPRVRSWQFRFGLERN